MFDFRALLRSGREITRYQFNVSTAFDDASRQRTSRRITLRGPALHGSELA
jgi:hypothetical protein